MENKIVQTAGRDSLGEFAPDFAHYNDDVLFGENWNNEDIVGWPKAWAVFNMARTVWVD